MKSPEIAEQELAPAVAESYGLRVHVLSPMETLAQAVSAIAPSTSAALTIPLVYALAGEGTCIAYVIAMLGMLLIALCIAVCARDSASPGSLFVYAASALPPFWAAVTAWSVCFAYLATAASVIGGFVSFAVALLSPWAHAIPGAFLAAVAAGAAAWVAYRDIQLSARTMLYIEATSVVLIAVVVAIVVARGGPHVDWAQFHLGHGSGSSVRLGVVLAVFSFVGFESATSLGAEAREPLKSIPLAVLWSTLLSGIFFVACAYGEVLGFRGLQPGLGESLAPMRTLAGQAGVGYLGPVIDVGVLISMFAATLAFVIALARMLMLMSRHGLVSRLLGTTNARHRTPAVGSLLVAALSFLPVGVLLARGASGAEVYGWMGSLAVFGYLTAYALVALATLLRRLQTGRLTAWVAVLAVVSIAAMLAVALGTLFPVPPAPYRYFPLVYAGFMFLAMAWHVASFRRSNRRDNHLPAA